jgi:hypothetical protein
MKTMQCPICKDTRNVPDNTILSVCKRCIVEMIEIKRREEQWKKIGVEKDARRPGRLL